MLGESKNWNVKHSHLHHTHLSLYLSAASVESAFAVQTMCADLGDENVPLNYPTNKTTYTIPSMILLSC